MTVVLPCRVLVRFGGPIEPRRTGYVAGPDVTEPPLPVDVLPGWVLGLAEAAGGLVRDGDVSLPDARVGMALVYIDWFEAGRVSLSA